ncbi:hypothetical protein Tco_0467861, partial [Tanacetum coccineum]
EKERDASVATNARQGKGKLHDIILTTSSIPQGSFKQRLKKELPSREDSNGHLQHSLSKMFRPSQEQCLMIRKYFIANTKNDVLLFHDKLIQHMKSLQESIHERAKHKREYDRRMNDKMMQSKEGKVDSSKALVADINSVNDKQPMAEVQLFAEHNIRANEQQHAEQSESVYDTYVLEKVDRNTIPKSTDMIHRGGEIDQNADDEKCQVLCPLLDSSFDNMTTKFSNQFLESENISLKKTVAQLQKDFSRMETLCVNMELKYQNQVLKNGQHG